MAADQIKRACQNYWGAQSPAPPHALPTAIIAVGGVSLSMSSVCWDTKFGQFQFGMNLAARVAVYIYYIIYIYI